MRVAILQHVECEPPGSYLAVLEGRARVDTFLVGRHGVPALDAYDAVVAMGGPMGVGDAAEVPWIAPEITELRAALARGCAVWGVCLGAQLLAAAAGAQVYPGPVPEVGVGTVQLTEAAAADPVLAGEGPELTVMHWHGDTFDLPPEATRLAGSAAYPNQAFRHRRSYGLQFHLEAPWSLATSWLALAPYRESLATACGPGGEDALRTELLGAEGPMKACAERLMARWLDTL